MAKYHIAIRMDITGTRFVWDVTLVKCELRSTASYKTWGSARGAATRAIRKYFAPTQLSEPPK